MIVLQVNDNLLHLDLSWNGLSDAGVSSLCEGLVSNCSLQYLDLSSCRMHVQGAGQLGETLTNNTTISNLKVVSRKSMGVE